MVALASPVRINDDDSQTLRTKTPKPRPHLTLTMTSGDEVSLRSPSVQGKLIILQLVRRHSQTPCTVLSDNIPGLKPLSIGTETRAEYRRGEVSLFVELPVATELNFLVLVSMGKS